MPTDWHRGNVPAMLYGHTPNIEVAGLPGWSWRSLTRNELALAWPLVSVTGGASDLSAWLELAGGWLTSAARQNGGLGALMSPGGVLVGLARHRICGRDDRRLLSVPWLRVLEVTAAPRCLEALVETLTRLARQADCAALELVADQASRDGLTMLADRLGLARHGDRWQRELGPGGEVVPLPHRGAEGAGWTLGG